MSSRAPTIHGDEAMDESERVASLVAHARAEAFAQRTQAIMSRLGYEIVSVEDFEARQAENEDEWLRPDVRIVDETGVLPLHLDVLLVAVRTHAAVSFPTVLLAQRVRVEPELLVP